MDSVTDRKILETEVLAVTQQLRELGHSVIDTSPKQDGTLDHLSVPDLRALYRSYRDLLRTLGGARNAG